ncbi:hypothetical protein [Aeromicrobium terrae]|uniref:Secreted protein n=1 Tax=Aeromicrobium terrae TaxID=2498846 RepID=A0A5C8NJJ1_9ACTN|nr:hypothetical protein [Aeromicrobium terrae]TXL61360.1 hypothetical protein FHP06_07990 [Aeromicrobium terrae]
MKTRLIGVAAATCAAAFALSTSPAAAEAPQPTAQVAGHLVAGPGAANVKVTYSCSSSPGSVSHLYVGVKQGPQVNATNHTSSQWANTFYSTNWKSDAGPNALVCDGKTHTQNIILKKQPGFPAAVPNLHKGTVLVQLCVYDNVTAFSEQGEPLDGGFAFDYSMHDVQAGK